MNKPKRMRVNILSESEITVQGHGVHTAYEEMASSLEKADDIEVIRGGFGKKMVKADIYHLHTIGSRMWRYLLNKTTPVVVSAHVVPDSFVGSIRFAKIWKPLATIYMKWFYKKADKVLAVSKYTEDVLINDLKIPAEKVALFCNSISQDKFKNSPQDKQKARQNLGFKSDDFVVICVGQIQPRKGFADFIEVAKQNPDIKFLWVGGMPFGGLSSEHGKLELMTKHKPDNVILPGIVPLEEIPKYYIASDLFFLPSEQETFGLVVIEAAAAGLPIVLRDIEDYNDVFRTNSWMGSSVEDFSDIIRKFKNGDFSAVKAKQKSKKIADQFDSARYVKKLGKIYFDLIKAKSGPDRR